MECDGAGLAPTSKRVVNKSVADGLVAWSQTDGIEIDGSAAVARFGGAGGGQVPTVSIAI